MTSSKEILVTIAVQEHHKIYLESVLPEGNFTYGPSDFETGYRKFVG